MGWKTVIGKNGQPMEVWDGNYNTAPQTKTSPPFMNPNDEELVRAEREFEQQKREEQKQAEQSKKPASNSSNNKTSSKSSNNGSNGSNGSKKTQNKKETKPKQENDKAAQDGKVPEKIETQEEFEKRFTGDNKIEIKDDYKDLTGGVDTDNAHRGQLVFEFPDYGYDKYVNDIANWQKQRVSFGAEPGWFFFKVFFNFNTNYGLLGGIMQTISNSLSNTEQADGESNEMPQTTFSKLAATNSAAGYLATLGTRYKYEKTHERLLSLVKFANTLKDISLRTPWLIKTISGLNAINSAYVDNFDKEKAIVLGFADESVDARLGTMVDLYKYSCYDQINCKEIIPANLRKFEMSIMIYHMPLKYYNTKVLVSKENAMKFSLKNVANNLIGRGETYNFDGQIDSKDTLPTLNDDFSNMMSFKLFTFLNCEIDMESINEYYVDGMSNEQPFKLGNNTMKIKYDRVYEHRMNEWAEMMFGSDGFQYNNDMPEIFNSSGNYFGIETKKEFFKNQSGDDQNRYRQRMNALRDRWYGKKSIEEYTDILISKYYKPDLRITNAITISGQVRSMKNSWNNMINSSKRAWNGLQSLFKPEPNNEGSGFTPRRP